MGRPTHRMSRELALVAGRPRDLPGCAASPAGIFLSGMSGSGVGDREARADGQGSERAIDRIASGANPPALLRRMLDRGVVNSAIP